MRRRRPSPRPARFGVLALLLLAALPRSASGKEGDERPRPRLALALSGGGARGIAHVGALRALEEAGLPVDAIAANSIGAVVGGIYATGRTAAELDQVVRSLDWALLFSGRPDRQTLPLARRQDRHGTIAGVNFDWKKPRLPAGALAEHRVNRFLIEHLAPAGYGAGGDFDRLPIPFRAVATALDDGSRVILARGDLARAVRASMSIPVAFPPVDWEGRRLVDGLVVDNLPVGVARSFGAAVVVGIDIGSPDLEPSEYENALGVAAQITNLLTNRRNADFKEEPDVSIRPELGKHSSTDYSGFDLLMERGYEATRKAVPQIRARLAEAGVVDFSPRRPSVPGPALEGARIVEVTARGQRRATESLLRHTFNIPVGPGFVMARGLRAFDKVEATGLLDHAWMEFEPADGGVRIVLRVKDAPPNRVEVGVGYTEWEKAKGVVRLRNQNTLGFGEQLELLFAASAAETTLAAALRGDRLVVAGLGYRVEAYSFTDKPRFFDDLGDEINRARFERQGADGRLQIPLERWGLLEAGVRFGRVTTEPQPGINLPAARDDVGSLTAAITLDRLDDLLWPEAGQRLALRAEWSLDGLGATHEYWRVRAEGRAGWKIGPRAALQLDGLAGLSGDDLQVYDHFRLGGPNLIPGYRHEELKGPQAFAGALAVRYRLVGELRFVVRAGAGNVFATREAIGLDDLRWGVAGGFYYRSRLGPLAAELGVRDEGDVLVSLSFGWN